MNLVALSNEDFDAVYECFVEFHEAYASCFETQTNSAAKPAKDYLQGQLFTKQQMNLTQYCREVPESKYEAMQHFIADSPWTDAKLISQLREDVCHLLGDSHDGALILDESGIPFRGKMSVGVGRQYCGRLGKVENCQVGVYLAYANTHHTSLVDYRLYLPESFLDDTSRRTKCGVPKEIEFQTKAQLGLEMIRSFSAAGLPFSWVSMDCHYGEQPWLLKALTDEGICYMADVPCDTRIFTSRPQTEVPPRRGNRGRHPTRERLLAGDPLPVEVRHFAQTLSDSSWTRLSVRETERGWLIADFLAVRVWHAVDNLPFQEVWLVMRRPVGENGTIRFAFSNAPRDAPLPRLAMMLCRRYWVERALEDAFMGSRSRPIPSERLDWLAPPHDNDALSHAFSAATDDTVSGESTSSDPTGYSRDTRRVLTSEVLFPNGIHRIASAETSGTIICPAVTCQNTETTNQIHENLIYQSQDN